MRNRLRFMELFLWDCGYEAMNSYVVFHKRHDYFSQCNRNWCRARTSGSGYCDPHYQIMLIRHYLWMRMVVRLRPTVLRSHQVESNHAAYEIGQWSESQTPAPHDDGER